MKHPYVDACPVDISDEDILKAMRDIMGYLDITPGDVKEIYRFAYRHAVERLAHSVMARDVMTKEVVFVKTDASLEDVADVMNAHLISGVPVIEDDQRVAGVISEKDILLQMNPQGQKTFMGVVAHCLKSDGCIAIAMRKQKAENIMTSPAITVGENTSISEIANIFSEKNINRAPVTDPNNRLLGIVTRTDIVRSSCSLKV